MYRMLYSVIALFAILQETYTNITVWFNYYRRRLLLPFALKAGRDMLLLKNGQWINDSNEIPTSYITMVYRVDQHKLIALNADTNVVKRCSWLSVIAEGQDISEFFCTLRISEGAVIPDDTLLMLYAQQKGWCPMKNIEIMLRDGTIRQIPSTVDRSDKEELNYIR
jgi:hypothetical protein